MVTFSIESRLSVDLEALQAHVSSMSGVNAELAPLIRMTAPKRWQQASLSEWQPGQHLFTSVILLFGVIPVDLHFFKLEQVTDQGFIEHSSTLMNAHWRHTRQATIDGSSVLLRDELCYRSRIPVLDRLFLPVYRYVFTQRHQYLRQRWS